MLLAAEGGEGSKWLGVGVSNKHRLVNLYLCALGLDGALKDTRFILVRAECPYVQSVVACVISIEKGL